MKQILITVFFCICSLMYSMYFTERSIHPEMEYGEAIQLQQALSIINNTNNSTGDLK